MKIFKIHHSQLDPDDKGCTDALQCDSCGEEGTYASNGDCSYCTECQTVEGDWTTLYLGLDGEVYPEHDVDWSGVACIGCLYPSQRRIVDGMTVIANHDNLPKITNTNTSPDGRCALHTREK